MRAKISIQKKMEIIAYVATHSLHDGARRFGVERQNIRKWRTQQEQMQITNVYSADCPVQEDLWRANCWKTCLRSVSVTEAMQDCAFKAHNFSSCEGVCCSVTVAGRKDEVFKWLAGMFQAASSVCASSCFEVDIWEGGYCGAIDAVSGLCEKKDCWGSHHAYMLWRDSSNSDLRCINDDRNNGNATCGHPKQQPG